MPTAFFSYSRDDSEFALRLAADLKAAGADVWLDQLDIEPGKRWARAVEEALTASPRMLVLLSPSSVASTNVEDEVTFALEEHKTVIPVLYRDCKIPFQLRPFQYVDFRTDYARGLKVMCKTLAVKEQKAVAAAEAPGPFQGTRSVTSDSVERKRAAELGRAREEENRMRAEAAKRAQLEPQEHEHEAAAQKAHLELEELERTAAAEKIRQQRAREQARPNITTAATGLIDGLRRARERLRPTGITTAPTGLVDGLRRAREPGQERDRDATSFDLSSFFWSPNPKKIAIAVCVTLVMAFIIAFVSYRALRSRHQEGQSVTQEAKSQLASPPSEAGASPSKPASQPAPGTAMSSNQPASGAPTATDSSSGRPAGTLNEPELKAEAPKPSTAAKGQRVPEQSEVRSAKKPGEVPKTSSRAATKPPTGTGSPKTGASDVTGVGPLPAGADPKVTDLYNRAMSGDSQAMSDLGMDYEKGLSVPSDFNKAAAWYRKAADAGNTSGMNRLGSLYENGVGVQKSYPQAVSWFRKAADAGNTDGMIRLGYMYSNGLGVEKDYVQASSWYRKAAASGSAYAMSNLGFMYQNGYGVERDYTKAVAWYRKAAEGGAPPGMFNLAVMYENGFGVARDQQQAVTWYRKAAQSGFPEAKKALERMGAAPN
jgi:TPR repeat protein